MVLGAGGVEPRPYGGQEDLCKPGVGRTEASAPTELYHGVRRGERNSPVTASPCQPPLGKGAYKDGGYGLSRPVCALASQ